MNLEIFPASGRHGRRSDADAGSGTTAKSDRGAGGVSRPAPDLGGSPPGASREANERPEDPQALATFAAVLARLLDPAPNRAPAGSHERLRVGLPPEAAEEGGSDRPTDSGAPARSTPSSEPSPPAGPGGAAPPTDGSAVVGEPAPPADRVLARIEPELRVRLERVRARMSSEHGHEIRVTEGFRSAERQRRLFEQGRTGPGPIVTWTRRSAHTEGRAVDVIVDERYEGAEAYARLQAIAAEEGLKTLGPRDPGHLELPRAAPALEAASEDPRAREPRTEEPPDPVFRGDGRAGSAAHGVAAVASPARVAAIARPAVPGVHPAVRAQEPPVEPVMSGGGAGWTGPERVPGGSGGLDSTAFPGRAAEAAPSASPASADSSGRVDPAPADRGAGISAESRETATAAPAGDGRRDAPARGQPPAGPPSGRTPGESAAASPPVARSQPAAAASGSGPAAAPGSGSVPAPAPAGAPGATLEPGRSVPPPGSRVEPPPVAGERPTPSPATPRAGGTDTGGTTPDERADTPDDGRRSNGERRSWPPAADRAATQWPIETPSAPAAASADPARPSSAPAPAAGGAETTASEGLERVARVQELQTAARGTNVSRLVLRVSEDGGPDARIDVSTRGPAVRASIEPADPGLIDRMRSQVAELREGLATRGLHPESLRIGDARLEAALTVPARIAVAGVQPPAPGEATAAGAHDFEPRPRDGRGGEPRTPDEDRTGRSRNGPAHDQERRDPR